jgi:hypothetical protein
VAEKKKKKKLTGLDRLWQEWKRRHPRADRSDFTDWLNRNKKAKAAVVEGKGGFAYGGYIHRKESSLRAAGMKALERRQAGSRSGVAPRRFSKTGRLPMRVPTGPNSSVTVNVTEREYYKIIFDSARRHGIKDPLVLVAVAYEESGRDGTLPSPAELLANPGDQGRSFGWWQFFTGGGLGTGHSPQQLVNPEYASNLIARTWAQYGGRSQQGLAGLTDYFVRVGRGAGDMPALAKWTYQRFYPLARKKAKRYGLL